ncbi:MAG: nuclear transport factor 2 family protein [Gammaproteobacteria bacterium]|nr:nuclear transport factor 2 family protein [Gammaproteobacteria bacterium]
MSAIHEVQTLVEQALDAFNAGDPSVLLALFDDDIEAIDHAPYRFDGKAAFVTYLQSLLVGARSASLAFHQPSYRAWNDDAATVNTYDSFTVVPDNGAPAVTQYNRTTYVLIKRAGAWRIVAAHFSPLPHA